MKHRVFGRKLGRNINSRKALLKNLTNDLVLHGYVKTTLAKAKFVRGYAEKAITEAKKAKLGGKRVLASTFTKKAFLRLVDEIAPGFEKRQGGYSRIIKLHPRVGDNAPMARIELLEWDKSKTAVRSKIKKVTGKGKAKKVTSQNRTKQNKTEKEMTIKKTGGKANTATKTKK